MYLSMLELNPRSRQVQSELRDPYQMHRTLSKAFGDGHEAYDRARCLFRIDESVDGRKLCVLVQSKVRPDWEEWPIPEGYLVSEPRIKDFNPRLETGQRLQFRLRANPTVKRDGRRCGIYDEEGLQGWLVRKGKQSGFRALAASVTTDGKQKSRTTGGHEGVFASVLFEGVLEVTDPEAFLAALESGIGSAKGFGFGLLSVAPVR